MSQLDPDQYRRIAATSDEYGDDNGWFHDTTGENLVGVLGGNVVFAIDSNGDVTPNGQLQDSEASSGNILASDGTEFQSVAVSGDGALTSAGVLAVSDLTIASEARGDILRRNASAWGRLAAAASGQVLLGDGTDIISAALSGDVSAVSAAGSVTLADPHRVRSATVAITATEIVGTDAGDLGHAAGVTLVAAVADKIIEPIAISIDYTHDTAAYTDGGDVNAIYVGGAACTGVVAAAASFAQASSSITILRPLSGAALVNTALALVSASGFTQPGTAAGTANLTTYYRLIDA